MTLQVLAKKIAMDPSAPMDLPSIRHLKFPVPDQLFILDESISGEECIIDGRKRFFYLFALASQGKVPWNLELSVKILDFEKILQSPFYYELSDLPTGILNVPYIRSFLLLNQDPNSEKTLDYKKLTELTREIYRHLINNLNSNHSNPIALVHLVAELDRYLTQTNIAKILQRSEGWVSDTIAVSKLPLNIFASMEHKQISYSAAVIIARAKSERERYIIFELAKKLDVRSLRDALKFLLTKPKFAAKKDAFETLLKMFSRKVMDVGGRAIFQIQASVERSLQKFFRSRMGQKDEIESDAPGKDPQSLVFRLKITIDGENAENLTQITPDKVEIWKKSIMDTLKSAV